MKKIFWIAALAGSLASAQTAADRAYQGQSWVGLLVSSTCDPGSAGKASRDADLTVDRRTTTPAVDDAGTRGAAGAEEAKTTAEKQSLPETGDVLAKGRSATDPGWAAAHKQAQSLGTSCAISASTASFGLLLPNGQLLQFAGLANQTIAGQIATRSRRPAKFIRVSVQGKLQDGKIALDGVQM